ncbi:MAG: hypothetical protein GC162_11340 [Planctomycetes bacterium]|nr:hypothetical protein [Planctomycetota bacterium]
MTDSQDRSPIKPAELVLVKKTQRWVFRYMPGEEAAVLRSLAETARDPASDFDWFDAAVLSHQMGDQMHKQLKKMMPG